LKSDGTNTSWDALDISTADITGTLPVANGGTGVTSSTGTGNVVLSNLPTLVTPILGTPQSGNFSTGTFTWPTFNQNTTGTAAGLSATLATTSGGTGLTSFTSGGVVYASSSSALATGSALTYDGTTLKNALTSSGVTPSGNARGLFLDSSGNGGLTIATGATSLGNIFFADTGDNADGYLQYDQSGQTMRFGAAAVEQMRLTSTGLGIGTSSPQAKLQVKTQTDGNAWFRTYQSVFSGSTGVAIDSLNDAASAIVPFGIRGSVVSIATSVGTAATFDASGNLGLGVTPSAWASSSYAFQLGPRASLYGRGGLTVLANNYYDNGTNSIYIATGTASDYYQTAGTHVWRTAASGTAGNAISFTQAMTLDASGRLGIGTTSVNLRLDVVGVTSTNGDAVRNVSLMDTQSASAGAGGGIAFGGYYNGTTDSVTDFAGIQGFKENGTAGNYAGALRFTTRVNSGSPTERARISSAGGFSVGTTADPGAGAIYATGNITAYYSDARLKTVSGKIENALDKVAQLSGVYYTNNDTAKSFGYDSDEVQVGVLAQDVEAVLPQIVKAAPFDLDQDGNSKSGENYKTVQYERLVPLLIEAINELQAKVKALESK